MGNRTVTQGLVLLGVVAGAAYLVLSSADGWADWAVFAAIVLTALGGAIAVSPRLYVRRRRTISRRSGD